MPRTVEFLKIVAHAVLVNRDESGQIVGEQHLEEVALYTPGQIDHYVSVIEASVADANTELAAVSNGSPVAVQAEEETA